MVPGLPAVHRRFVSRLVRRRRSGAQNTDIRGYRSGDADRSNGWCASDGAGGGDAREGPSGANDRRGLSDETGEQLIATRSTSRTIQTSRFWACSTTAAIDRALPTLRRPLPKLGKVDDIVEFCPAHPRVDLVLFTLPISAESAHPADAAKKLWVLPVDIRLSAHTNKLRFAPRLFLHRQGADAGRVRAADHRLGRRSMKWMFDKVVGSVALLFAALR